MFLANQPFIFLIFSSVAPQISQPTAKCFPMWQPTRRLAVSCALERHQIQTRDCRTIAWRATTEPPRLPTGPPCLTELSLTSCWRTDWTFYQHPIPELFFISILYDRYISISSFVFMQNEHGHVHGHIWKKNCWYEISYWLILFHCFTVLIFLFVKVLRQLRHSRNNAAIKR
jgi:hypothetical protein